MGEPTSSEYIRVTTDWSTLFRHGGAACVRHCAAAPFAGSGGSADFVRRTSPVRKEGGRSGHAAPPPQASATTSTRRRRARWNSGCSTTRWITAPLPRPLDQPGATTTASTTTTTAPETLTTRGTLQHEDTPTPHGESPDPPQQHPASPTLAAQQAAALIWVAAQHDIARRDNVINTMRNRWWQQLCSRQSVQHSNANSGHCAVHARNPSSSLRRSYGWRQLIWQRLWNVYRNRFEIKHWSLRGCGMGQFRQHLRAASPQFKTTFRTSAKARRRSGLATSVAKGATAGGARRGFSLLMATFTSCGAVHLFSAGSIAPILLYIRPLNPLGSQPLWSGPFE